MTIPSTMLTTNEVDTLNRNEPTLSKNQGIDLGAKLNAFAALVAGDNAALISGQATILNAATTVIVAVGTAFDGKFGMVSFGEAPTAATILSSAPVTGGNLTITSDQDNTADLLVNWSIDGR